MKIKIIVSDKNIIVGIQVHVFVRTLNIYTPVTRCDEIVIVMVILSTKKTKTIVTNFTSTASLNYHSKKVRDCYILHTILLVIILLLTITICYYTQQKGTI